MAGKDLTGQGRLCTPDAVFTVTPDGNHFSPATTEGLVAMGGKAGLSLWASDKGLHTQVWPRGSLPSKPWGALALSLQRTPTVA